MNLKRRSTMNRKLAVIIISVLGIAFNTYSQSSTDKAKVAYFAAEEAYNNEDYSLCIKKLEQAEYYFSTTNPKILELKIKAFYNNNYAIKAYNSKAEFFEIANDTYPGYNNILRLSVKIDKKAFQQFKSNGKSAFNIKEYNEAIEYLQKAYEIDYGDFDILNMLGISYYQLQDYKQSEKYLLEAHIYRPSNMETKLYLAYSLYENDNASKSAKYLKEYVRSNESSYDEIILLAKIMEELGNVDESKIYYGKASEIKDKEEKIREEGEKQRRLAEEKIKKRKEELEKGIFIDDRDNQTYKIVKIGSKIWMADNLKLNTKDGSRCYKDDISNCEKYGKLYNWNTAKEVCPEGWHLPKYDEWIELFDHYGGLGEAKGAFLDPAEWKSTKKGSNASGFNALPGGRIYENSDYGIKGAGFFWSNKRIYGDEQPCFLIYYGKKKIQIEYRPKDSFYASVRCIRDSDFPSPTNAETKNTKHVSDSEFYLISDKKNLSLSFEERHMLNGEWILDGTIFLKMSEVETTEEVKESYKVESTEDGIILSNSSQDFLIRLEYNENRKQYELLEREKELDEYNTETANFMSVKAFFSMNSRASNPEFRLTIASKVYAFNDYLDEPIEAFSIIEGKLR